ncbi:MAG: hypothetical protein CMI55_00850 [Parcubacteria group bacterium]|nr:hypothetical protein [Parcubacteria group bacterium]
MAISTGVLGGNADVDDLTVLVRQEMINRYVLRDAIFYGFLSKKATTESLTTEIRTKMKRAGLLKRYLPDGTINKF